MSNRVRIYEVAERAGVSISTVSQAFNRPQRVGAATRERVLAAAEELGFVPSAEMAIKARKTVGRVGVVAPLTGYSSYMRRLAGVLQHFTPRHTEVGVYDHESAAVASPLLSSLPLNRRLDGLIVMGLAPDRSAAERVLKVGLPTVVVDFPTTEFTSVMIDDEEGGHLVATHLIERGHRSFAYVIEAGRDSVILGGHRRLEGFRDGLRKAGVEDESVVVVAARHSLEHSRAGVRELLSSGNRPSAIACHDDIMAAGALLAARDVGLAVPGDVAVIGYDDGDLAATLGLTTVKQPFEESGLAAAVALSGQMARPATTPQRIMLDLTLVVRNTT